MTVGDLPERLEQSSSRDHDPSIGSALEGAKLTVRRALEAADNANHAGEQAVLRMEQALVAPLTDFGDIAAAAYEKVVGGSFEDLEAHEQQFYINFAVEAALSSAKPSDGEGSRDELLELIRSLEGENARLTGERDHYQRRAEDAEGSLTQADVAVEAAEDRAQKAEARLGSHDYCMCGDRMDVHDTWSGHAPVSQYDYRLEEAESHLQEALATIERMRAALEKAEASLAKAVEGLEKLIDHFEDDGAHDEGAFDDGCSDCHVLQSARETLASIRQEPKGSEAYAKREGEEQGASRDQDPNAGSPLERAIFIAAGAHNGQIDKGGAPYIHHVLRVVRAVERPEDKVVAALHDLLEDCADWTPARLKEEGFSGAAIEAVVALTRRDDEMYDAFIRRVAENDIARRVKLADLADNSDLSRIRAPSRSDQGRVEKYARATAVLKARIAEERP